MTTLASRTQAERIIAASRLALGLLSLLAVWLDPAATPQLTELASGFHWFFVIYSAVVLVATWLRGPDGLILVTQTVDIIAFSILYYLSKNPASPFFIYLVFSMFSGAIRWGWRGTLVTSIIVTTVYVFLTALMSRSLTPAVADLNRVIVRVVYLVMAGGMLVYLGRHEARLRDEIESLARWPAPITPESIGEIVEHAARIVGAQRAVLAWQAGREPLVDLAVWTPAGVEMAVRTAADIGGPLSDLDAGDLYAMVIGGHRPPVADEAATTAPGSHLASASFRTDRVSGRVIFGQLGTATAEAAPLTEVVAREIGASLDQMHVTQQLREIAAREERLRLARDLHDGVLQSLTGIRLELRALAQSIDSGDASAAGRTLGLERALAMEQRELRYFIDGLRPASPGLASAHRDTSLAERLERLRERIALEWTTPVSIQISPTAEPAMAAVSEAVPLMVHEAVTNALKHAGASSVTVRVDGADHRLHVHVADDGHGFGFKGRYDHAALKASTMAPRSLFERVSALGGEMSIESSDAGSRVEIVLAL